MSEESIFSKIIRGEVPSLNIYEDDKTIAFLDIYPTQPGHTLVVPKKQIEFLWDLPDEEYQAVMKTSKKVAKQLRQKLGVKFVGVEVVGVDVPHAHVHLIPFNTTEEFRTHPDRSKEPDFGALKAVQTKLTMENN